MSNAYRMQTIMRQEGLKSSNAQKFVSLGKIISYKASLVIVELYPADDDTPALQTGWIPLMSPWAGNGWGMFAGPMLGAICEVHYQEGSLNNAYATLQAYSNKNPALDVPSGEFWLVHKSGSYIKFLNDGSVEINANTDITMTCEGDLNVDCENAVVTANTSATIDAPSVSLGAVSNAALTGILTSVARTVYNEHTHDTPSGESDPPNQQMGSDTVTEHVTAN